MSVEKLPKGWEIAIISDVAEIVSGIGFPKDLQGKTNGKFPFYKVGDISRLVKRGRKFLENAESYIDDDEKKFLKAKELPRNTIVFAKIGEALKLNRRGILSSPSFIDNNVMGLIPKRNIENLFLYYFLLTEDLGKYSSGNTVPSIRKSSVAEIQIPLPPLPEQQQIVAKLDAVFGHLDRVREKLDRIPELLKNFRQQVLTQAVTGELTREWREGKDLGDWEEKKLNEISLSITDGDHQAPPKAEIGVPFLVISDISNGRLDLEKATRFVPNEYFQNLKEARKPKKHDILYTVTGSIGIPVLLEDEFEFTFQRHIGIIRPNRNLVNEKYLFYALKSEYCLAQGRNVATGTAQLTIPLGGLRNYNIPLPTYSEQQEILQRVNALFGLADKIESQYQSLKAKIDNLPQAILAKAFRGELVGQEVKKYVREIGELGMVAEENLKDNIYGDTQ